MLNNQRVVVHKDDISEHAEKSQSMVYVKRFQLDVSGIEECLPPQGTFGKIQWTQFGC